MNNSFKSRRLFFALWPSDQIRLSINNIFTTYQPLNGRVMVPRNLHVTLHFLGLVNETSKDCMHAAAQTVKAESFQFDLDCFGHFSKAKIFWMGPQETPDQLLQLHERLGHAVGECGFVVDERRYAPHVTLMRKCMNPAMEYENFCIPWIVEDFVLVESVQGTSGVEYRVVERYPLL